MCFWDSNTWFFVLFNGSVSFGWLGRPEDDLLQIKIKPSIHAISSNLVLVDMARVNQRDRMGNTDSQYFKKLIRSTALRRRVINLLS